MVPTELKRPSGRGALFPLIVLAACSSAPQEPTSDSPPPPPPRAIDTAVLEPDRGGTFEALAARYDSDGDGSISRTEHGRGDDAFGYLDRDHDGILTAADFASSDRPRQRGQMPPGAYVRVGGPLARCADLDDDAAVSQSDWQQLLDQLCVAGSVDMQMLGELGLEANRVPMLARMFDADRDGNLARTELDSLFDRLDANGDGRIAGIEFGIDDMGQGPKVGDVAPDFELPRVDDPGTTVQLSSFRGERPVALIFGSYT